MVDVYEMGIYGWPLTSLCYLLISILIVIRKMRRNACRGGLSCMHRLFYLLCSRWLSRGHARPSCLLSLSHLLDCHVIGFGSPI